MVEKLGGERVGEAQHSSIVRRDRQETVAMRDRRVVAGNPGGEEFPRRHEWNDLIEQEYVQAAAGNAEQTRDVQAVAAARCTVVDRLSEADCDRRTG